MSNRIGVISNLDFLVKTGILPEDITLNDAVCILTDPLNCVECIALEQCADRYGTKTGEATREYCMEAVFAFLEQDHKEEKEK